MKKQLLLGCGHSRDMRVYSHDTKPEWDDLTTLDMLPGVGADIDCDLDSRPLWSGFSVSSRGARCLDEHGDFLANYFDEIHAYEVLEHLGSQGDYHSFFDTFFNCYRILVPGGLLLATVPSRFGPWLWGDPGHTRAILQESLTFLDQEEYFKQLGKTAMSDYRSVWKGDFQLVAANDDRKTTFSFVLRAIKPARVFP
jgi:hypothetical protein